MIDWTNAADTDVPEDFTPLLTAGQFVGVNGPIYMRVSDRSLGFRVRPAHCNPIGICHGGWLATFLDMQLPASARHGADPIDGFPATVSLSLDYISGVEVGSWVEGRATILDRKGSLIFTQAVATSFGSIVVRGSGVYKVLRVPRNADAHGS
jgi:acyl-coenzyme A thioesterase PaaI-like protein